MHPKYVSRLNELEANLIQFDDTIGALPGVANASARKTLAKQFVESERKIDRTKRLAQREPSADRIEPSSDRFDPELSAVHHRLNGNLDEAAWLVFLSVHFGRHKDDGWLLCRQIYGGTGPAALWTWNRAVSGIGNFSVWLADLLRTRNTPLGRFGNHRKYESLGSIQSGLAAVLTSYIDWVIAAGGHESLFQGALAAANQNPEKAFALLYGQMGAVLRFGRLGKFDYLTTISKLGLAAIEADATYLASATGPKRGAKLLFCGSHTADVSASTLEQNVAALAAYLHVGMQAMEDALCNWQKSPQAFVAFRG